MLRITVPPCEWYDEKKNEFLYRKNETVLSLEHSLVSLSKWESRFKKPFLSAVKMTREELLYYIQCMTLTQNVTDDVYEHLSAENLKDILTYINDPMTATWFKETGPKKHSSEQTTSELIYFWMVSYSIPFECQKWHLNRLLTLIKICEIKNTPAKKRSRAEILTQQAKLNAERRNRLGSKG